MIRLSTFISENIEPILIEWEKFALTLFPQDQQPDQATLRDHGKRMLETIAVDLSESETAAKRLNKSKGGLTAKADSPAGIHGLDRLALGFSLTATIAEYRALRASVIRLWQEGLKDSASAGATFEDLIRFNEAVDQAISESIATYSAEKDQQTQLFNIILSTSPDLTFTVDRAGRFLYANRAFLDFHRLPWPEVQGKKWTDLVSAGGAEIQAQIRAAAKGAEEMHTEVELISPSMGKITFDCIFAPVKAADKKLESVAGMMRDITERKMADDKNWTKANFDELTGLPNRTLFFDRLEQAVLHAVRSGTGGALLFIDLDRFKEANDRFGHSVGDSVLKFVSDRIRACVRGADTVARLGGDEFTVILLDVENVDHIRSVAEKIVQELATPFRIGKHGVDISASIGISLMPQDAITAKTLISNADAAMYAAKSRGRNQVVFYSADLRGTPKESTFGRL